MRSDANFQAVPKSVYYRGRAHRTKLKPFRPTDERQRGSMRQPATKESDCRLAGLKIEGIQARLDLSAQFLGHPVRLIPEKTLGSEFGCTTEGQRHITWEPAALCASL